MKRLGLAAVTFSCRALDRGNRSIGGLAERILGRVRPDDIIMLHDLLPVRRANLSQWLAEVKAILSGIPRKALVFRPLSELIGHPVDRRTGYAARTQTAGPAGNNPAASYLIDFIGLKRIGDVLQWYYFYVPEYGGGIWLGARYPPGGERNPEPIKGLSHAANVMQICRFYYMLANGEIISPERSRQMLEILSRPGLHDKFVSVLEKHVSPERLYRKSGDWDVSFSDSVLVCDDGWRKYILAALIEDKNGERILRDLVPVIEGLLKPSSSDARSRQQTKAPPRSGS